MKSATLKSLRKGSLFYRKNNPQSRLLVKSHSCRDGYTCAYYYDDVNHEIFISSSCLVFIP